MLLIPLKENRLILLHHCIYKKYTVMFMEVQHPPFFGKPPFSTEKSGKEQKSPEIVRKIRKSPEKYVNL